MNIRQYDSAEIALRIKAVAKSRGTTIKQMLEEIGLAKGTLDNFKTSMPKADNLAKIADYLDVSLDYLMDRQKIIAPIEINRDDLAEVLRELDVDELNQVLEYAQLLLLKKQSQALPIDQ